MTLASLRTSRRPGIAIFTTLLVLGTMLGGVAYASSSPVRKYVPSISPACAQKATNVLFTATITNHSSSNQQLGSVDFHSSSTTGFSNILSSSFSTPVASGGKTWKAIADTFDADGIFLEATSSANTLSPGQSVSVSFIAKAPSSTGNKTWSTTAYQATNLSGSTFSLAPGATQPVVNVANACVGPPAKLAFSQQPATNSNTAAGATLGAVKVQLLDAANNLITTDSSSKVTLSIGNNAGGGTLTGGGQVTLSSGIATFAGPSINKVGNGYTFTAASTLAGVTGTTSNSFNIIASGGTHLAFVQQPSTNSNNASGANFGPVSVQLLDASNNLVTSDSSSTVALAIGTNPSSGMLSGTTMATLSGGIGVFSPTSIDKVGTGYTLSASLSGVTSATSNAFNITPGPADHLTITQQPANAQVGADIGPIKVELRDAAQNVVTTDSSSTVTLTFAHNATPGALLTGGGPVTLSSGVATLSPVSVDKVGNGYTLNAASSISGVNDDTSTAFNVTPGNPAVVTFDGPNGSQPTNTLVSSCINSSDCMSDGVKVYVTDNGGNPVPGASVALTLGANPPGTAALSGTLTQTTDGSGVASFPDLKINKTSSGFTLIATVGSITPVESDAFAITNTDSGCTNDCTATFPSGGTVSGPAGTTFIIETNQLNCDSVSAIAGTVTIIPPNNNAPVQIAFDDMVQFPITGPYPFCKAPDLNTPGATVPFCNTISNGLNQSGGTVPCVDQSITFHGTNPPTLHSVLWIEGTDPVGKH